MQTCVAVQSSPPVGVCRTIARETCVVFLQNTRAQHLALSPPNNKPTDRNRKIQRMTLRVQTPSWCSTLPQPTHLYSRLSTYRAPRCTFLHLLQASVWPCGVSAGICSLFSHLVLGRSVMVTAEPVIRTRSRSVTSEHRINTREYLLV